MTRVSWTVALVAAFAFSAVASAQTAPASSAQPVTVAAPAAAVQPAATAPATAPTIDLAQIFAAPTTAISTMPEPKLASCTLFQCRQGCHVQGCFSVCVDLTTCECDVICN